MMVLHVATWLLAIATLLWFTGVILLAAARVDARRRMRLRTPWLSPVSHPYEDTRTLRRTLARRPAWRPLPA